jgi:hypothetical protein
VKRALAGRRLPGFRDRGSSTASRIDSRISLRVAPVPAGSSEGAPLFDCARPLVLEVPIERDQPSLLAIGLTTVPDSGRPVDARVEVHSGAHAYSRDFACRPVRQSYGVPLAVLAGPRAERTRRGIAVRLVFSGRQVPELRLSDLKLERDAGWSLRSGVQGISFPRSGHHMLVDVLKAYFGSAFHYCGFYSLCDRRPCPEPSTNLQKNHDHRLDVPRDECRDYLIQYRHPLPAVASHYELRLRRAEIAQEDDCADLWRAYALEQVQHWKEWVHKWVLDNENPRALKLSYEQTMADPVTAFSAAVRLIAPDDPVDLERITEIAVRHAISARRDLSEFRYYDADFFARLESLVRPEVDALGLHSRPSAVRGAH